MGPLECDTEVLPPFSKGFLWALQQMNTSRGFRKHLACQAVNDLAQVLNSFESQGILLSLSPDMLLN